jgi:hypothetical protein
VIDTFAADRCIEAQEELSDANNVRTEWNNPAVTVSTAAGGNMRSRRDKRRVPAHVNSSINITPLIDVLLVLIVIFMVITPVTPKGFETSVPSPPRSYFP